MIPVLAVLLSFIIGGGLIYLSGADPFLALNGLFMGAFGDLDAFSRTLEKATPLVFNGLALTLAFKAGLFNIGVQGQFLFGAIISAAVGCYVSGLPVPVHMAVAVFSGIVAGAVYGMIQGALKAYRGAHEVITGIMLNYVAINITDYWTKGPFMDTANSNSIPRTPLILESCQIPDIWGIPSGFLIAVLVSVVLWLFLKKTVTGFEIKTMGQGIHAARYAGIKINGMMIFIMGLSGGLAGIGGAVETMGVTHRFQPGFNLGLGFEGITIALLSRIHPVGVLPAALLLGGMKAGAGMMQFSSDIPTEIIDMMMAMILLFVAADKLMTRVLPVLKKKEKGLALSAGWGSK